MGIVTVAKRPKPGAQKHLHFVRPRSDASLFWGHEIVFLADIDSHKTSFQRTLAEAAFWVRLMNHTLKTNKCLPVFWINDLSGQLDMPDGWAGECYLVYEQNANVGPIFFSLYHNTHVFLGLLSSFAVRARNGSPTAKLSSSGCSLTSTLPSETSECRRPA